VCRIIRGGNRRIPAAATAGYQARSVGFPPAVAWADRILRAWAAAYGTRRPRTA
jgi:hypothetical protein